MPSRQLFTKLCQSLAQLKRGAGTAADLHLHTIHSDGLHTPAEMVSLAKRSGLCALAITDHDTLGGVRPAREAAGEELEVIAGVEISTGHRERELHLLAYFVDLDHEGLLDMLAGIRRGRVERLIRMVERLNELGVDLRLEREEDEWRFLSARGHTTLKNPEGDTSLGRPTLARILTEHRLVGDYREAFSRYLHDRGRAAVPKDLLPVEQAISVVHQAGGLTSWAHPPVGRVDEELPPLCEMGLDAVEVEHPQLRPSHSRLLRQKAIARGLMITGGSDCHGHGNVRNEVGSRGLTASEWELLKQRAGHGA